VKRANGLLSEHALNLRTSYLAGGLLSHTLGADSGANSAADCS
jgi:hypothetical protein